MKKLVAAEQLDADGKLEPKFQRHPKNPPTKHTKIINPKAAIDSGEFDTDLDDDDDDEWQAIHLVAGWL